MFTRSLFTIKPGSKLKVGQHPEATQTLVGALKQCPDYCFPNQPEAVVALQWAVETNPEDYKALYYLGNFWYAFKNYDKALTCWRNRWQFILKFRRHTAIWHWPIQ
jgi:tetratricopeptide (TPR) repeat protein